VHELAGDFRLEDVWALPAEGAREDFPRLVEAIAAEDPADGSDGPADPAAWAARVLWSARLKLGAVLGLDDPQKGVGSRVTLRERLPDDLRGAPAGPGFGSSLPFSSVYLLEDEWAAEIANRTMHGVLHVGWVPTAGGADDRDPDRPYPAGPYRGQLAILVKPNGALGRAYMTAIRPFRHRIVYPAMMRRLERIWNGREL